VRDVPFLPAARTEFLQALDSYAAEDSTLAADFLTEVERASQRISTFPEHGSPYLSGTRRVILHRRDELLDNLRSALEEALEMNRAAAQGAPYEEVRVVLAA
jgi:heme oxygenase